ncbi:hypothetical protein H5410_047572 [Solanum commersonii]|uniref:Uncharacterized protein n=1 Tax=Solanum commersonii TaxID=4109 RepID=A0A9J5XHH4_SOLCO|nr:hypothetical protein H5410_047572 [Solanum commersonii]
MKIGQKLDKKSIKYIIKTVPTHAIRFCVPFNTVFLEEFQKSIGNDVIELFRATIFGPYLDISKCNFQGQISKCLLLLELEQGNSKVLHIRHANGAIPKNLNTQNQLRVGYSKNIFLVQLKV